MCGIVGFVDHAARYGPARMREIVESMRDTLTHRGPDDCGSWVSPDGLCALGHRRLSILDLSSNARQPMVDEGMPGASGGPIAITFNGEIYNYIELRDELRKKGFSFTTESDTEVLLRHQRSFNPDLLDQLSGMYAFATWETKRRRLSLARDPFGKKPLYVAQGDGWLAFASELRALLRVPEFSPRIDRNALSQYLLLQYVPAPLSILEGCSKLEPGTWATYDFREERILERKGSHFRFDIAPQDRRWPDPPRDSARHFEGLADELKPVLCEAISQRLRSDVPLGAFLSGGIDSGLVVGLLTREFGIPIDTFSIGFANARDSEHHAARKIAAHLGTQHHDQILEPSAIDLLPGIVRNLDEPLGDPSCLPTYLLSEFCRKHVTVAISGDGGDELFGGYRRYRDTVLEAKSVWRRVQYRLKRRHAWSASHAYCNAPRWLMFTQGELTNLIGDDAMRGPRALSSDWRRRIDDESLPLIDRLRELDAGTYLPGAVLTKVDRMSMAHALEVRSPLLDRGVAAFASRVSGENCIAGGVLKPILRSLASRYLPEDHVARPKLGFGLPSGAWAHGELVTHCETMVLGSDGRLQSYVGREGLAEWVQSMKHPRVFRLEPVWNVLVLEYWLRQNGF